MNSTQRMEDMLRGPCELSGAQWSGPPGQPEVLCEDGDVFSEAPYTVPPRFGPSGAPMTAVQLLAVSASAWLEEENAELRLWTSDDDASDQELARLSMFTPQNTARRVTCTPDLDGRQIIFDVDQENLEEDNLEENNGEWERQDTFALPAQLLPALQRGAAALQVVHQTRLLTEEQT